MARQPRGTRVTWVIPRRLLDPRVAGGGTSWSRRLEDAGFGILQSCGTGETVSAGVDGLGRRRLQEPVEVVTAGRARSCPGGVRLYHKAVHEFMDPRDRGIGAEPSILKAQGRIPSGDPR